MGYIAIFHCFLDLQVPNGLKNYHFIYKYLQFFSLPGSKLYESTLQLKIRFFSLSPKICKKTCATTNECTYTFAKESFLETTICHGFILSICCYAVNFARSNFILLPLYLMLQKRFVGARIYLHIWQCIESCNKKQTFKYIL
jgi:hypothetical protein